MAATDLSRAVTRMLTRAGHARYGKGAGFKLVLTADSAVVVWIPETRRRSPGRLADALAQATAHAGSARAAGWDATVTDDGGWPACRVSRKGPAAAHDHSWAEDMDEVEALCPDHNPALAGTGIRCPGDPAARYEAGAGEGA